MSAGAEQGENIEVETTIEPVGAILSAAREERGIELESVSKELNIAKRFLEALENDDFDALPGSAYAIGFVRSYAEFLGLDCESLSRAVKRYCRPEPVAKPTYSPQPAEEARKPGLTIVMVTGLSFAGILAGWKLVTSSAEEAAITPPAAAAIGEYENRAEATAPTKQAGQPLVVAERSTRQAEPVQSGALVNEVVSGEEAAAKESAALTATAAVESEPVVSTQPEERDSVDEQPSDASSRQVAENAPVESELSSPVDEEPVDQSAESASMAGLEIVGKRDTWILITDADENTLFDGVVRAGESYRPPEGDGLLLTTADAAGLTVSVGTREFDLDRDSSKTIVEIKLDARELLASSRAGGP